MDQVRQGKAVGRVSLLDSSSVGHGKVPVQSTLVGVQVSVATNAAMPVSSTEIRAEDARVRLTSALVQEAARHVAVYQARVFPLILFALGVAQLFILDVFDDVVESERLHLLEEVFPLSV